MRMHSTFETNGARAGSGPIALVFGMSTETTGVAGEALRRFSFPARASRVPRSDVRFP